MTFLELLPILIPAAVIVLLLLSGYVKAPPDQAYIISGLKKDGKILIGRAGIKIPFLERLDRLYLGQMTVDIKTEQSVPTNDFINVNVDAVAKVRISPTTEGIKLAAKNFLNKKPNDITLDLQDSLQGNMREIIGTLSLKEINTDRDSFSDQVMQKASKDMNNVAITDELSRQLAYSALPSGSSCTCLVVPQDNTSVAYEDFSSIGSLTVGLDYASSLNSGFVDYCKDNDCMSGAPTQTPWFSRIAMSQFSANTLPTFSPRCSLPGTA